MSATGRNAVHLASPVHIDHLLELAVQANSDQDHRLVEDAMNAALWMEEQGLAEAHQVGNFGGQHLVKGQKVRIKKGTVIRSMHPRHTRDNPKIAGRDYIITVFDTYTGHVNSHWHPHARRWAVRNHEVLWPGEGGYWCTVDSSLVELVN